MNVPPQKQVPVLMAAFARAQGICRDSLGGFWAPGASHDMLGFVQLMCDNAFSLDNAMLYLESADSAGLHWSAKILLRSLLEMWLDFRLVVSQPVLVDDFFDFFEVQQHKWHDSLEKANKEAFRRLVAKNPQSYERIKSAYERNCGRFLDARGKLRRHWHGLGWPSVVQKAGLPCGWYHLYQVLCAIAHPNPVNLMIGDLATKPLWPCWMALALSCDMVRRGCAACRKDVSQEAAAFLAEYEPWYPYERART